MSDNWLDLAIAAAKDAGNSILSVYKRELKIEQKEDGSPLTEADRESHRIILEKLTESRIPIVSEEGDDLLLDQTHYWLVDPLDGTKDFIAKNGYFTVNIALVVDQLPVLGVVYAPARDELFVGHQKLGAWVVHGGAKSKCISGVKSSNCRMAVSRFHDHPDVEIFAQSNGISYQVAVGSALKFGYLATGDIDVYPRLVGSAEWDTAAGQAILVAAGGSVLEWHSGKPLRYGKTFRRNPRFLALRNPYSMNDFKLKTYNSELL